MLGCERDLVRIVPYQAGWADLFQQEASALKRALGDQVVCIEHVGSTSVPGLDAKPILDIVVAVCDMADATSFENVLAPLGYVHKAENDRPGRLYFVRRTADDRSTHHLNITELGTECWFTHVAFRDYLREHAEAREEYRKLKLDLARRHALDRAAYQGGKGAFIERALSLAREAHTLSGVHVPGPGETDLALAEALIRDASLPEPVADIEFLDKGYSTDRKYVLRAHSGTGYLLRVSDIAEERIRRANFELVSRLWETGVACPQPICFETSPEQGVCFMVLAYLPGDCARDALPKVTPAQQYAVGHQAGEELAKIHRALAPVDRVDDYVIRGDKYVRHQRFIQESGFSFRGQDRAERYVAAHLDLLKGRPTTLRHGDYHPGNLVVQGEVLVGVVDFNRCDWGDPIDDFYKIAFFGAPLSPEYARGQVTGYFGGELPDGFWQLYNLYVAMVLPADIVWTQQHYPQHLGASLELIEIITSTHDFEDGGAPAWWLPAGQSAGSP
jgi:GrpB-like predicted nucleotidyltransferase (UPF0157 family)/aminoglycoside phosphotransferase (APT) family kinase protein